MVLLACGSSGLRLNHLPALRTYMQRFAGHVGMLFIHSAGDARKTDEPEAFGADRLREVAVHLEWPWFREEDVERFPADWRRDGHRAGPQRNEAMRKALRALAAQGQRVGWVAAHTDPGLTRGCGAGRSTWSACTAQRAGRGGRSSWIEWGTSSGRSECSHP